MGLIANLANSTYHAMQLTMNRRFSQGLYFTTSYTLSKSLDYVSSLNETGSGPSGASGETDLAQNPFNLRAEHGPSIFDARHRWVMSASWELPIFKNSSGAAKAVLAGWQLNGIAISAAARLSRLRQRRLRSLATHLKCRISTTVLTLFPIGWRPKPLSDGLISPLSRSSIR
jgi:hypothetical protein